MNRIKIRFRNQLMQLAEKLSHMRYLNRRIVFAADLAASCFATLSVFAILLRISPWLVTDVSTWMLAATSIVSTALLLYFSKVYRVIIRHMSFQDVVHFFKIALCKGVAVGFFYYLVGRPYLSGAFLFIVIDGILTFCLFIMLRSTLVSAYYWLTKRSARYTKLTKVLIYGAHEACSLVDPSALLQKGQSFNPVAYFEVNESRKDLKIHGLKVLQFSNREEFDSYISLNSIDGILFTDEEGLQAEVDRVVDWCMQSEVNMYLLPCIERTHGEVSRKQIREVHIEDLLGRERIAIDGHQVDELLVGKRVLVSGAAGSIGSEIVRQLCKVGVKEITCFDNAETPLHNLELEIRAHYPAIDVEFVLGDVRSKKRISGTFARKRPHVVYHAAAYKHVPMIERNPCEGILVNVLGTKNMAEMAVEFGVERFVMVSTDKAVRPTNVMGATKRLAEIFVQSFNVLPTSKGTTFVTTRFGNVLGSNGSVIPLFREQIQKGGPITVTHPDITRYFMTIPEACRLVLQASAMAQGGEIFVFDMGQPVKIADLAKRMIRLAGLTPGEDIEIVYSGLRPGEKLYEELLTESESTTETQHGKIRRAVVSPVAYAPLEAAIQELIAASQVIDVEGSVRMVKQLVPDFVSNNSRFEVLDGEKK